MLILGMHNNFFPSDRRYTNPFFIEKFLNCVGLSSRIGLWYIEPGAPPQGQVLVQIGISHSDVTVYHMI